MHWPHNNQKPNRYTQLASKNHTLLHNRSTTPTEPTNIFTLSLSLILIIHPLTIQPIDRSNLPNEQTSFIYQYTHTHTKEAILIAWLPRLLGKIIRIGSIDRVVVKIIWVTHAKQLSQREPAADFSLDKRYTSKRTNQCGFLFADWGIVTVLKDEMQVNGLEEGTLIVAGIKSEISCFVGH